jgi:hypothetical protein
MRCWLSIFLLSFSVGTFAQGLVEYDQDFEFREGLYLNFQQFQQNNAVHPIAIVSDLDKTSFDFYDNLLAQETIQLLLANDSVITWYTADIWGYCKNNNIYITEEACNQHFNDSWMNFINGAYRLPVVGRISHFVADVQIRDLGFNDPWMGGVGTIPNNYRVEMRQYMLDFESGKVLDYELDNFEQILQRDVQLFEEYNQLNRRQKRQKMFIFLRRFNEANPIYFPAQ